MSLTMTDFLEVQVMQALLYRKPTGNVEVRIFKYFHVMPDDRD